jgi:hypothetical protein
MKVVYDVGDDSKLVDFYCQSYYQKHKSDRYKRVQNPLNLE